MFPVRYELTLYVSWHINPLLGNARNTRGQQYCSSVFCVSAVSHTTMGRGHVTCFLLVQPGRQWTSWVAKMWHMFSAGPANAPMDWLYSEHVTCVFYDACPCCIYISEQTPCGGGVEYLHRDPASLRRRRKGKSQIWDSKIWPWVLWDSDQKMTVVARASRNCKWQSRPLVREVAPNQQSHNCQTIIKIWS
jgi:hypothetical protein